jgi:hypothetical protein
MNLDRFDLALHEAEIGDRIASGVKGERIAAE